MVARERYRWLRDALADKGLRAKDVAKAWGCDDAVVSRFIKTGEPALTWERAAILARMLGLDMNELQIRFADKPLPAVLVQPETDNEGGTGALADVQTVLEAVRAAVKRAKQIMPGYHITVKIELENGNGA